jgi:hypothetical protein
MIFHFLETWFMQGEKECSYYIKTGHCKFGVTCKFHHPELGVTETSNIYPPVQPSTVSTHPYPHFANLQMGRPPFVPGSFLPGSYPPMMLPSTVMPMQGWNPYVVSSCYLCYSFFKRSDLVLKAPTQGGVWGRIIRDKSYPCNIMQGGCVEPLALGILFLL